MHKTLKIILLSAVVLAPLLIFAQPPPPPPPPPAPAGVPLDGGILLLLSGLAAYGFKKLRNQ